METYRVALHVELNPGLYCRLKGSEMLYAILPAILYWECPLSKTEMRVKVKGGAEIIAQNVLTWLQYGESWHNINGFLWQLLQYLVVMPIEHEHHK